jgi:NADPH-dependent curcumin reductase CurA
MSLLPPVNLVQQGEVVVKNLYLSIDATMRIWISGVKKYMDPVRRSNERKWSR